MGIKLNVLLIKMYKVLTLIQFAYMTRTPLRVREGFLDCLINNIQNIHLKENLELKLMAIAIKAFGSNPNKRIILCNKAIDKLIRFH